MGNTGESVWLVLGLCLWLVAASLQTEASFQEHLEDTGKVQRKLLMDDEQKLLNDSSSKAVDISSSSPWPILVGLLLSVLSVAFVIVLVVKFRLAQRFCVGYSEALLPEGDTASQFSQPGIITGHGMAKREPYVEDDDGFIEDNYISASDKERAEKEGRHEISDEESDDELDMHFSIE